MPADNEVLFLVTKKTLLGEPVAERPLLFRTRATARAYARAKTKKSTKFRFMVTAAKWGPGQ